MATVTEPIAIEAPESDRPADITADEFFAMVEAGVFADRRVLLWGGRILEKMAKTVPHAMTAVRIGESVRSRLPGGWFICPENPVRLDQSHVPLPDVAVVRGTTETYEDENRHPTSQDVSLLVEVAVTSLTKDLGVRAEKFARASVPVYWVADVKGRRMIEHRDPQVLEGVGSYRSVRGIEHGEAIDLVLDGAIVGQIPVAEMLR